MVLNNAAPTSSTSTWIGRSPTTPPSTRQPARCEATATITLTNTVDPDGLPSGVTGNYTGDPVGTNRTLLSLYTPLEVVDATVGARRRRPRAVHARRRHRGGLERGLGIRRHPAWRVGHGDDRTRRRRRAPTEPTLVVRPMPMVLPERHRVDVRSTDGTSLIAFDGIIDRTTQLNASSGDDG